MSKPRKESVSWSGEHEALLFELWEEYLEAMRSSQKNFHIYQIMCEKLCSEGFNVRWKEVRSKVDNLTRKYRTELKKMEVPGTAPSKWHHFHRVHKILAVKSENFSSVFVDSPDFDHFMSNDSTNLPSSSRCEEPSAPPPSSKRRKFETDSYEELNQNGEMTLYESAMLAATRERTEEIRRIGTAVTDFLGRFEKSFAEFQTKLLDKL